MTNRFEDNHPRAAGGQFTEKPHTDPGASILGNAPLQIRPGMQFTHDRFQDLDWRPGPGQKYADAPLARMKITAHRNGYVYFTYANDPANKAGWHTAEAEFIATFGDQLTAATAPVEPQVGMRFVRDSSLGECEITKVTDDEVLFKPVGMRGASLRNSRSRFLARYGDQLS